MATEVIVVLPPQEEEEEEEGVIRSIKLQRARCFGLFFLSKSFEQTMLSNKVALLATVLDIATTTNLCTVQSTLRLPVTPAKARPASTNQRHSQQKHILSKHLLKLSSASFCSGTLAIVTARSKHEEFTLGLSRDNNTKKGRLSVDASAYTGQCTCLYQFNG